MKSEEISPRIVMIVLGMILSFVAFYLSLVRVDGVIRNNQINSCAAMSRFEKNDKNDGSTIMYPIRDVFVDCLKRKGL
ncbi:MAG: hypothetical protein HZC02_03135 [Candidatus Levybacteria bacterium]|nr:hypothetical protein [Candidatus Levybacteria bacterium]